MGDIVEGIQKYHDNGDDSFSKWVWIHGSDVSLGGGGSVTQGTTPWVDSLQASTLSSATLQSAATATGNGTDFTVTGMAEVRLTITISAAATVTFTGSEDGTNFFAISAEQANSKPSSTATASGLYSLHIAGLQKVRAAITSYGSGTVTVTAHAAPIPTSPFMPKDSNGNILDSLATLIAGEDLVNNKLVVEQRNSYQAISTATTTTVKSGAGFLHRIIVTGGTTGTIVIWDNTAASGTTIASFDTTNTLNTYEFNVSFATGLTIVTSAATKLTVSYR